MNRIEKLKRKLKKTYMRMLRAYARGLIEKGYRLEDKSILLELELRDESKT
jgi:hypothetical protein